MYIYIYIYIYIFFWGGAAGKKTRNKNMGVSLCQRFGVPVYWCPGVSVCQYTGIPVYWCTCVPVHRCTDVPVYLCTGEPVYQSGPKWVKLGINFMAKWHIERVRFMPFFYRWPGPLAIFVCVLHIYMNSLKTQQFWASGPGHL